MVSALFTYRTVPHRFVPVLWIEKVLMGVETRFFYFDADPDTKLMLASSKILCRNVGCGLGSGSAGPEYGSVPTRQNGTDPNGNMGSAM